jgi:hypothetical protein
VIADTRAQASQQVAPDFLGVAAQVFTLDDVQRRI